PRHGARLIDGSSAALRELNLAVDDPLVQIEVILDHAIDMEVGLDAGTTRRTVELADQGEVAGHVLLVGTEVAGAAVVDDLRSRALREGEHRRSAGERLDHHESERLVPTDRVDECLRTPDQRELLCAADL